MSDKSEASSNGGKGEPQATPFTGGQAEEKGDEEKPDDAKQLLEHKEPATEPVLNTAELHSDGEKGVNEKQKTIDEPGSL